MKIGEVMEALTFGKLKRVLGDLGFGIWRKVYIPTSGQEVDLLIFNPHLGVWLLSVKSYFDKEQLRDWIIEIHEARDSFLDYLKRLNLRGKVWAGALLVFPRTSRKKYTEAFGLPEEHDHVLILFKEDLDDVESLRRKLLNRMKKGILAENLNWDSVLGFFGIVPKKLSLNPQRYICFLDDVQADVINRLHSIGIGHKLIRGGAGTGKTWLILKILERIEESIKTNLRVLLMCFNRNLQSFFKEEVKKLKLKNLNVDIERIPLRSGSGFPLAKQKLSQILERGYDIVFCDEVQDYHKEAVETILENNDNVALFCDDAQRIYVQSKWTWEEIKEKFLPECITLTAVYRSPDRVFRAGVKILEMDERFKKEYGEYINNVLSSSNSVNNWGKFFIVKKIHKELIKEIMDDYKVNTSALLFPHWEDAERDLPVTFSDTYLRSKGLEFDAVFLKNFWDFLEKWTLKKTPEFLYTRAYTSITRGRFLVVVEEPSQDYSPEVMRIYEVVKKEAEELSS